MIAEPVYDDYEEKTNYNSMGIMLCELVTPNKNLGTVNISQCSAKKPTALWAKLIAFGY